MATSIAMRRPWAAVRCFAPRKCVRPPPRSSRLSPLRSPRLGEPRPPARGVSARGEAQRGGACLRRAVGVGVCGRGMPEPRNFGEVVLIDDGGIDLRRSRIGWCGRRDLGRSRGHLRPRRRLAPDCSEVGAVLLRRAGGVGVGHRSGRPCGRLGPSRSSDPVVRSRPEVPRRRRPDRAEPCANRRRPVRPAPHRRCSIRGSHRRSSSRSHAPAAAGDRGPPTDHLEILEQGGWRGQPVEEPPPAVPCRGGG